MKKLILLLLLVPGIGWAQTYNNNIVPAQTGQDLGTQQQRWDAFFQNVDVSGYVRCRGKDICTGRGNGNDGVGPHTILSTTHTDTIPANVQRGDLITGQGTTPFWARLGKGSAGSCLRIDPTGFDIQWQSCDVPQPVDIGVTYNGVPTASLTIVRHPFPFAVSIPAGCTNSSLLAETAANASTVFSIQKCTAVGTCSEFGTATFAGSATSATFACSTQTDFAAGNYIKLIAPSSPDSTLALVGGSIYGVRAGVASPSITPPTLATVAYTGSYTDLINIPTFATVALSGQWSDILGKPAFATVATTGSWNDLVDKPSFASGSPTGSGDHIATASGVPADGCAQWSGGNIASTGSACGAGGGGGGGSGTVLSGTTGQFAYYSGAGTTVAGKTLAGSDIPNITESQVSNLASDLALLAPLASPTFTGTVAGITKGMVGLGNVDNTSDLSKPISTATQTALNAKATDSSVVHNVGNETVAGIKTFSSTILGNIVTATSLFTAGTPCNWAARQVATGVDASGNAVGCNSLAVVAVSGLYNDLASKPDLTVYVPKTTTVAGHALSSNVTITPADVSLANVDNVKQLPYSLLSTKGDLLTYSTLPIRFGVGANGTCLGADSAQATGLSWVSCSGTPGVGVPTGGTTSQVLAKASNTNFDTAWVTLPGSGTVTDTAGALVSGQLLIGNAGNDLKVGDLSGDVTTSGSAVTTLANIPTATPMAGSLLATNIAAPGSPASGKVSLYTDSTALRFHDKNASGVIGTTVVADTGAANNFLTAISAAGVISKAQPTWANIDKATSSIADITTRSYSLLTGLPQLALNTTATATQFFNGYNSTTGAFTKAQPAWTDISGKPTVPAASTDLSDTANIARLASAQVFSTTQTITPGTDVTGLTINGRASGAAIIAQVKTGAGATAFAVNADGSLQLGVSGGTIKVCYTATVCDFAGAGSPLGIVIADIGSTYRRTDGGASTTFYVKESNNGASSGWVAK